MADYKTIYTKLFNAVTDAIIILQTAQIETEELFISQEEAKIIVLNKSELNKPELNKPELNKPELNKPEALE